MQQLSHCSTGRVCTRPPTGSRRTAQPPKPAPHSYAAAARDSGTRSRSRPEEVRHDQTRAFRTMPRGQYSHVLAPNHRMTEKPTPWQVVRRMGDRPCSTDSGFSRTITAPVQNAGNRRPDSLQYQKWSFEETCLDNWQR